MRIGCVTRHRYPTAQEVRITKLASTLMTAGHEVFVFCPGGAEEVGLAPFEFGHVARFRALPLGPIGRFLQSPVPINPIWAWWLTRLFRRLALDVVVIRDLRLGLPAFLAARICGIRAILDLGEHYPGMIEALGKQRAAHYITRNHWLITKLEALSVGLADAVWVVVEENRDRLRQFSQCIDVVSNYPVISTQEIPQRRMQRSYSTDGEPISLISLGLIDNIRGLDLAIDAFSLMVRELSNVRLTIYGDGFFRKDLERQVRARRLEAKVLFGGWVPEEQKYGVLHEGDIGLLLHKVCDLTQHTVPNKLFDYMYAGLPVVSTKLAPVSRILDKERCGIVVDDNPQAVAGAIRNLVLDPHKRQDMSDNGRKAVCTRYNWAHESAKALAALGATLGR